MVVKTAREVGRLILSKHFNAADAGERDSWIKPVYSVIIYIQYAVPTAMRKMGTIIVSIERGMRSQAINPNVQTRLMSTLHMGRKIPEILRNRKRRTRPITKKVIGGSWKKSFCVYFASASKTTGIPI